MTGVRAGDDEITAEVVILAEGTNSMLSERCLGNARPKADQMAVGIKEVFELPADVIEDRFLLPEGEGAAMLFVGDCTKGSVGGGFLYTNKESISLGLVATISLAADGSRNEGAGLPDARGLQEPPGRGPHHPRRQDGRALRPHGARGRLRHDPEVRLRRLPDRRRDRGPLHEHGLPGARHGLRRGVGPHGRRGGGGRHRRRRHLRAAGLAPYKAAMEGSFVIQDLRTFSKWPHVMEEWSSMFTDYPVMVKEVFNAMFSVDGAPQRPLMKRMGPIIKKRGALKLAARS